MASVRGCELPDELLYDVKNNIWYRPNDDGSVTLGITMVAAAMSGSLLTVTPKKIGKEIKAGKSCATIESGKWVGPARVAFDAEIMETNSELSANAKLANSDPYGQGWLVKVKPTDWDAAKSLLISGTDVAGPYEEKMAADEFAGCAQD